VNDVLNSSRYEIAEKFGRGLGRLPSIKRAQYLRDQWIGGQYRAGGEIVKNQFPALPVGDYKWRAAKKDGLSRWHQGVFVPRPYRFTR
jgi:hypothetical protein